MQDTIVHLCKWGLWHLKYSSYSGLKIYNNLGPKVIQTLWPEHVLLKCFSLIANTTFLHHILNKMKHCLAIGWLVNWYFFFYFFFIFFIFPPRKGRRRARRRDLRQPQCRRPRVPWRQARRLHRQPTIPGRTGPWARRPKGPPPHNRGPARPVGPGPANRPPRVGRRSPEHPAPAREITNAPAASSTGRAWWWGGGRLRWWVRRSLRPDLTHRRRRQAHIYTSICPHPHARKRIFTPSPHM